jgi:hypothetical protein
MSKLRNFIRGKRMVKKTNEEFEKLNDAPEVTPEVDTCACDKLKEIGFYRCQDDMIYITFLCQDCQKIIIKKYNLVPVGELKYG